MVKEDYVVEIKDIPQVEEGHTAWEHDYVCKETGERISISVTAGSTPPKAIRTPKGGVAYKDFGTFAINIPAWMRANTDAGDTHSDAKKMMNHGRKRAW
ncbi:MAG: hypothetical protein LC650_01430 [Actinobacteria bacterium]|nr:hypothetical protein [Actinomycetota bacterium]